MPEVKIKYYCEADGNAPVNNWLERLKDQDRIGYARCIAKIRLLSEMGLNARRPAVEYLRDCIFEIRAKHVHIQYRILFFYQNQKIVILAHGLIKKSGAVPESDIDIAIERKKCFELNRERHTYDQEKSY